MMLRKKRWCSTLCKKRGSLAMVLGALMTPVIASAQSDRCGMLGCNPNRDGWLNGAGLFNTTAPAVLWSRVLPGDYVKTRCVAVTTYVLCGLELVQHASASLPNPKPKPARGGGDPVSPALVALTAADGATLFNSSSIGSCMVTPAVVDFAETIAASESAMTGVTIGGQPLGAPIPIELTGVFAPASTTNDVIIFIRRNGEILGYLSNGIPHASINIPEEPRTPPAIRDSSVYLLAGGGLECVVYRVDVHRTMNDRFQVMWRQEIGCPPQIAGANASLPTVPITVDANSGRIYFPSTWSGTSGHDSGVVTLDDSGGSGRPAVVWRCPVGGVDYLGLAGGMLWTAGAMSGDASVAVVNASTGRLMVADTFPAETVAAPIVVTNTACLVILRSHDGSRLRAVSLAVSAFGIKQLWSVVLPAAAVGEVGMPVVVDNDPTAARLVVPVGQTVYGLGRALRS